MPLPFLAPIAAKLASPLIKWGIVALVVGGLVLAVIWYRHEADVARESQAVAERQAAISAADAARWQAASDVRDAAIGQLKTALDEQSAAVTAARAKEAEMRRSLDSARQQNDRLSAEAEALARELDEEERAAPGDVRPLGPIVTRRAPALFE